MMQFMDIDATQLPELLASNTSLRHVQIQSMPPLLYYCCMRDAWLLTQGGQGPPGPLGLTIA
jgi:hypothetical protein